MAISIYNMKKWSMMLTGKSIMHVNQNMGMSFEPGKIKGYFNNLTEKVTKDPETLKNKVLPIVHDEKGDIIFPVAIFQYGLGAYDLYLQTLNDKYFNQFELCVIWAIENQEENGAWKNFCDKYPDHPYGAMCQGEGASLLVRAYKAFNNSTYLEAAKKAIDFMLKPVHEGGTSLYSGENIILMEYTHLPVVLNGWIFAIFGLYDVNIVSNEEEYKNAFDKTITTLKTYISKFDNGYWSMYDLGGTITSPFYHSLHVAQMEALYKATGNQLFIDYKDRWSKYQKSYRNVNKAFVKKVIQKIIE